MNTSEIVALTGKYVMNTYARLPVAPVRGRGSWLWDADGKKYLDFTTGLAVNGLGHSHPRVVRAIREQSEKLLHCSNLYHIEPQALLARWLVEHSAFDKAFFCNSGAEANEAAIKLARRWGKLRKGAQAGTIISALNSFHGRTLATVTATGQPKYQKGYEPLPAGFVHVPLNDIAALENMVDETTCAIMLEPVQGEGGVHPCDPNYVAAVRKLCDREKLAFIFDEVQAGLGRTGKLFAYEHFGVVPDIVTIAKALGGGIPIGAMLATEEAASVFEPGTHASTFGGNPFACAVALAAMTALEEEGLVKNARSAGEYFVRKLRELAGKPGVKGKIAEVRGMGLLLAAELSIPGKPVVTECIERGLLINCIGEKTLRFLPPLNVSWEEIDTAVSILEEVLRDIA